MVAGLESERAGTEVFLLTDTVLGRLSKLFPITLESLLGAEDFLGEPDTAVLVRVGLGPEVLRVRVGVERAGTLIVR